MGKSMRIWGWILLGVSVVVLTLLSACTSRTFTTPAPKQPSASVSSAETFSLSSSNRVAPADILEEVVYYGGGAGMGCLNYSGPGLELGVTFGYGAELGSDICSSSCGWSADERIKITLTRPDGHTSQMQKTADEDSGTYGVYACYDIAFDDPSGKYKITYQGDSGKIEESIFVAAPDGPRLYVHDLSSGILRLRYFRSNEHIRLLAYGDERDLVTESRQRLLGWQDYFVDQNGELTINVRERDLRYVVVGDRSGEVWPFSPDGGTQNNGIHSNALSDKVESGSVPVTPTLRTQELPAPTSKSSTAPATCSVSVHGPFEGVWRGGGGASKGCPVGAAFVRDGAYQYFEKGIMIWHAGSSGDAGGMIYVIYDGGNWQEYPDRFVEGQTEKMGYAAPSGMLEPVRGFGKVWRDELGGPPSKIGWALSQERASQVTIQPFNGTGVIISCDIGTYFLPHGYKWNQ